MSILEGVPITLLSAWAAVLLLNWEEVIGISSPILNWASRLESIAPLTTYLFSTETASALLVLLVTVTFSIHPFLLEE